MSIDDHLHGALGYMLPDGVNVEQLVVGLFERVQDEARYSDAKMLRWQGEEPLAKGWGQLVVMLERICDWDKWEICRRDTHGELWVIMSWESCIIDVDEGEEELE